MIVEILRNGRRQRVNPKVGLVLQQKGIAKIVDDVEPISPVLKPEKQPEVKAPVVVPEVKRAEPAANDGLDELDRDQLVKIASDFGISVHHRSGEDKIRADIRERMK